MLRAAIYARVSTDKQRERHTIASQLASLPEFARRQGWEVVGEYVDDGLTAKAGHLSARRGFSRLLADADARKFDIVIVIDLDRLTRSEDLTERGQVLGAFQRAGVRIAVASTGQVLDLATSGGDLFASLHAFFAAEENRKRRERTSRGRAEAARRGRPSAKTPLGLRFDRATGEWREGPEAELVRELFRRLLAGETLGQIAGDWSQRGIRSPRGQRWHRASLRKIVVQSAYRGEWLADRSRKIAIRVPALVEPTDWYAAQDKLAANRTVGLRRTKHVYLLEACGICGSCGGRMRIRSPGPSWTYYVCERRFRSLHGERCGSASWRVEEADARIWTAVVELLERADLGAIMARAPGQKGDEWAGDLAAYRRRLKRIDEAEAGVLGRYRRGLVSEHGFDAELERIAAERRMLERQVATAENALSARGERRAALARAQDRVKLLRERLPDAAAEVRREIVVTLLAGRFVTFYDEHLEAEADLGDEELDRRVQLTG